MIWNSWTSISGVTGGPMGFEPNGHTLDTLMDYLVEQGLMRHRVPLEELFLSLKDSKHPTLASVAG